MPFVLHSNEVENVRRLSDWLQRLPTMRRWNWRVAICVSHLKDIIWCKSLKSTSWSLTLRCVKGQHFMGFCWVTQSRVFAVSPAKISQFLRLCLEFWGRLRVCGYCVCRLLPHWRTTKVCCSMTMITIHSGFNRWLPWILSSWRLAGFFELFLMMSKRDITEVAYNRSVKEEVR